MEEKQVEEKGSELKVCFPQVTRDNIVIMQQWWNIVCATRLQLVVDGLTLASSNILVSESFCMMNRLARKLNKKGYWQNENLLIEIMEIRIIVFECFMIDRSRPQFLPYGSSKLDLVRTQRCFNVYTTSVTLGRRRMNVKWRCMRTWK